MEFHFLSLLLSYLFFVICLFPPHITYNLFNHLMYLVLITLFLFVVLYRSYPSFRFLIYFKIKKGKHKKTSQYFECLPPQLWSYEYFRDGKLISETRGIFLIFISKMVNMYFMIYNRFNSSNHFNKFNDFTDFNNFNKFNIF